jgi:hyperosmotically inducible periplasmic protein
MKHHRMMTTAAIAAAMISLPALAQESQFGPPQPRAASAPMEYAITAPPTPDAIHSGANNPSDEMLADTVAAALAADGRLDGATITVAANNGRVSLTGSARTPEQAGHAENIARSIAGVTAVSGTLSPQGG